MERSPNRAMYCARGYKRAISPSRRSASPTASPHHGLQMPGQSLWPIPPSWQSAKRAPTRKPLERRRFPTDGDGYRPNEIRPCFPGRHRRLHRTVGPGPVDGRRVGYRRHKNMPGGMIGIPAPTCRRSMPMRNQSCRDDGRARTCRSCRPSRLSAREWPGRCRRKTSKTSSRMPALRPARAAGCTRRTR